jgi:hypothetical protein
MPDPPATRPPTLARFKSSHRHSQITPCRRHYGDTTPREDAAVASEDDVRQGLLDEIAKVLKEGQTPLGLLLLAEAYAWVLHPNQAHGAPVSSRS